MTVAVLFAALLQADKAELLKDLEQVRAQKTRLEKLENEILKKMGATRTSTKGQITYVPKEFPVGLTLINQGREHGIAVGDTLKVFRGEQFVAMMQAVQVDAATSQCQVRALAMGQQPQAGDSVEKASAVVVGGAPTEEAQKRLLEMLSKIDPNLLRDLGAARAGLETQVVQMTWLVSLSDSNPARCRLELEIAVREQIAKALAAQWKALPEGQRRDVEGQIRRHLEGLYDARARSRRMEIEEIERKLAKVKDESREEAASRQKFVNSRLKELKGE
jgi:hypothetical protein